jgi:hypothetical protein
MNTLELNFDYCAYFEKKQSFLPTHIDAYGNGDINIIFSEEIINQYDSLDERFSELFKEFACHRKDGTITFVKNLELGANQNKEYDLKATDLLKKYFIFSTYLDQQYYVNVNETEKQMPNTLAYFGILYILSSIVRYKPDKLHKLIDDKDTSVSWMLSKICSVIERVYPNLLLNLLFGQSIKFSASSMIL